MGEVKDNLPQGSSRNKIEYLADAIDSAKADAKGASAPPKNLLCNPDFTQSTVEWGSALSGIAHDMKYDGMGWLKEVFGYENQSATQMHLGRSLGRPAPLGWGVEIIAPSSKDSVSLIAPIYDSFNLFDRQHGVKATGVMTDSMSRTSKTVHFSVFTTARNDAASDGNPNETLSWEEPEVFYSAYFLGRKKGGVRFGIVELDVDGNATQIVAQQNIAANDWDKFTEQWIHNIKLRAGQLYAYFVESDSANHRRSALPLETGVFINTEKLDIVPDMTPHARPTHKSCESLGLLPSADVQAGVVVPIKSYHSPFGVEKHFVFAHCGQALGQYRLSMNPLSITRNDATSIRVQGTPPTGDANVHLMAFYSETPLYINFSNATGV
ncbi:hypothetical protein INR79_24360 [Vibrio sp. SCSIO 43132]|uniref:hypothetical protein n=1 Tax=Vibrio sp. SCSIO 43132 TaxID=2779363 RepID=UPI001CA8D532|nr:hypothetical protein [Vibrio sp. SCSIO 43132]UAB72393.1 hypothetical protein INR79_24360 [Vibrio sp. SCSIO 43132]